MYEQGEIRLGDYSARIEEDQFFLRAVGPLTLEIARGVIAIAQQIEARHGRLFILCDLHEAGPIPADVRRIFADHGASHPPAAIAIFGGGLLVRGVNALLFGAMNLIGKKRQNVRQFSSEPEARAWLTAERQRLSSSDHAPK